MISRDRLKIFSGMVGKAQAEGYYPYFHSAQSSSGPEAEMNGKKVVMAGSNDYLGLCHDPRVIAAAEKAMRRFGTGPGGSRFLSGNLVLHDELEERLAGLVGKKKAIVHTTGFMTNEGILGCLLDAKDIIVSDRENHASIMAGCNASPAKMITYSHNDPSSAADKMNKAADSRPDATILLVTDGVFSMSGDVARLPELVAVKDKHPKALLYLDDAHGIGVLGRAGRGSADHFGVTGKVDFIMGTFSKALASIGGFVASDDEDLMVHLKHTSRTLMFSAGLPPASTAAVLECLDILEKEPDRVERLRSNAEYMRQGYKRIGIATDDNKTPILPILIGKETAAYYFASELFANGVFAMPAIHPAVPRGKAIIRTAYMATHEKHHLDHVLGVLEQLVTKHKVEASH